MEKVRLGVIGLGCRGKGMLDAVLCDMPGTRITYICDLYRDRVDDCLDLISRKCGYTPKSSADWRDVVASADTDAILVYTSWRDHIMIAVCAMRAGKKVGVEVGGAYSVDECFGLVEAYRETGVHCMMLENCCYGREEMLVLNMVKQGLFGEIVYCAGGYHHDLREEISMGDKNRHYRLENYKSRNCENYPTHELGPIAKILDLGNGNRMTALRSFSTKARGLNEYAASRSHVDDSLSAYPFAQGDVVTTVIECAGGENVVLTLDTTLPRAYCRGFTVRGTKAGYCEWDNSLFIDGVHNKYEFSRLDMVNNVREYYDQYDHPVWRDFINDGVRGGHGGMDWLVTEAFLEYARGDVSRPAIDTFDTASWMCITPLSEASIRAGGEREEIPDFTDGEWKNPSPRNEGVFALG